MIFRSQTYNVTYTKATKNSSILKFKWLQPQPLLLQKMEKVFWVESSATPSKNLLDQYWKPLNKIRVKRLFQPYTRSQRAHTRTNTALLNKILVTKALNVKRIELPKSYIIDM